MGTATVKWIEGKQFIGVDFDKSFSGSFHAE